MSKRLFIDCTQGISGESMQAAFSSLGVNFSPLKKGLSRLREKGFSSGEKLPAMLPASLRNKGASLPERLLKAMRQSHSSDSRISAEVLAEALAGLWGILQVQATEVWATPPPWFAGLSRDGIPLPRPLTLELMQGKPWNQGYACETGKEPLTPGAALLLDQLIQRFWIYGPELVDNETTVLEKSASGQDGEGRSTCLHLFARTFPVAGPGQSLDEVIQLSCHLDHLNGEDLGHAIRILGENALDVLWLPGLTKKNRPGGELRILCRPEELPQTRELIFKHTHTLGLRLSRQIRILLPRRRKSLPTPLGELQGKEYDLEGDSFWRAEYEDLAAKATKLDCGLPSLRVRTRG
ncbi:MAG: LarC family nickel insertion protein [Desulfovibrionaceae bacterium]|nr:LarC family nickel insertion protein [Desulfovibrionaceae bacterium]